MGQRRHHYEQAFEHFLRERQIPFVSVNEARRALFGGQNDNASFPRPRTQTQSNTDTDTKNDAPAKPLKSFDHVLYGDGMNLLVDVKGRKIVARKPRVKKPAPDTNDFGYVPDEPATRASANGNTNDTQRPTKSRLESWVTQDDVDSLTTWQELFGDSFSAAFVFVYWCDEQPPAALFEEIFNFQGRWYAVRAVELHAYRQRMKVRSPRWRTVHVPTAAFDEISGPLVDVG